MKTKVWSHVVLLGIALVTFGCSEKAVVDSKKSSSENSVDGVKCENGEAIALPSGEVACVYAKQIVIETGFSCPVEFASRFDFQTFTECDRRVELPFIDLDFLNYRDLGALDERTPWDFVALQEELSKTNQLDLLWVIDNSGSMCEEQKQLRESFDAFAAGLAMEGVDFQVGVTTTQMVSEYPLEPVAKPGLLQATPQPVPGFDRSCWNAIDQNGQRIEGDYSPIREALAVAVECMETPDRTLLQISDDEIACALEGTPGCEIASVGCGGAGEACVSEDIFPPADSYRMIPRVMRSSDYRLATGDLDIARLRADFACASLVGTRGYGIEEGLRAAVSVVSPDLTSAGGENEGFIRPDARFAVFFVTDENDCSHEPGSLDLTTTCGGDVCEFANHPDAVDSPLIPAADLRDQLIVNLAETKGRPFDPREVFVASFHGPSDRYSGSMDPTVCDDAGYLGIAPECATTLGVSYSGDRYDRFLRAFPLGNTFPYAPNATVAMEGWMCTGDLAPGMASVGTFLSDAVRR